MSSDRGISTVVDVALALFFITGSIAIVGVYMANQGGTDLDPQTDARTAESLQTTTISVEYSLDEVKEHPQFDESQVDTSEDGVTYNRSTHGTTIALIAHATMLNVRFSDNITTTSTSGLLTREGVDYNRSVNAGVSDTITGMNNNTQVIAIWRPYEDSEIEARETFGKAPPQEGDFSSTTLTVDSGAPEVDDSEVEQRYRTDGDYSGVSELVAQAFIERYFPETEYQGRLSDGNLRRQLVVYRYMRMAAFFDDLSYNPDAAFGADPLSQSSPDAQEANAQMKEQLAEEIANDMRDTYGNDITAEELSDRVSTGEVEIVVRTW